jgi:hypothetical protein
MGRSQILQRLGTPAMSPACRSALTRRALGCRRFGFSKGLNTGKIFYPRFALSAADIVISSADSLFPAE